MGQKTSIEWTDRTWNPVRGCSKASPGCENCYAIQIAARFSGPGQPYEGLAKRGPANWTGKVRLVLEALVEPFTWRKPQRVFVNSMSDLFHPEVPEPFIFRVLTTIARTPWITYQVLTKRADRMREVMTRFADLDGEPASPQLVRGPEETRAKHPSGRGRMFADYLEWMGPPPPDAAYPTFDWMEGPRWWPSVLTNLELGVSIENQEWANRRIPDLLATPAAIRFVSAEPLLGPIDLMEIPDGESFLDALASNLCHLNGVIVGGESGRNARPMHPAWVRGLRDQCIAANVPFFFKQWGEWREPLPGENYDTGKGLAQKTPAFIVSRDGCVNCFHNESTKDGGKTMLRVGKKAAGRLLDGREWNQFPEVAS